MDNPNFDAVISVFAKKVAGIVLAELGSARAEEGPRLLTVQKAATYIGRTEEAVQHMLSSGKIPAVRLDRRVFVDLRDLEELIEDGKRASP